MKIHTIDANTREIVLIVTYNTGQMSKYEGKLASNGEKTNFKFTITKATGKRANAIVGDYGYAFGILKSIKIEN